VTLGLIAGWGGTQRLSRLVGKGRAFEILLSGENINAEEAAKIGLINKVIKNDKLIDSVEKLALSIIKNAPLSISSTIKTVNCIDNLSINEGLEIEKQEFSSLFKTQDALEGLTAFLEKRKAKFIGK